MIEAVLIGHQEQDVGLIVHETSLRKRFQLWAYCNPGGMLPR